MQYTDIYFRTTHSDVFRDISQKNTKLCSPVDIRVLHYTQYDSSYYTKLRGLSPHANYTDRAAAAGRRS